MSLGPEGEIDVRAINGNNGRAGKKRGAYVGLSVESAKGEEEREFAEVE